MSRKTKQKLLRALLYLTLVIIAIIALFPLVYIILASFRTDEEIFRHALPFTIHTIVPVDWTFENYQIIFTQFSFWRPMVNTLLVVCILVPVNLLVASLAGYAFAFFEFKFKGVLFAIFIISFMVPTDSIALPLYSLISDMGLVNRFAALILPSVSSGLAMFLFTQFFRGIPKSFLEAARVDGANWGQIFYKIILPLSVPVFITAGLMIFVTEWNNYLWPLLVTRSESVRTIQVALAYFKDENETFWSYIYAAASISALVPVALFLPLQKYFVQGVTSSGVKG
ncbi:MAG: carbohydrate ABC transporter permease [Eubacteriales bacterium]|nr:carbohydrate ABC transporter permease [Eubacteriales bacterium]